MKKKIMLFFMVMSVFLTTLPTTFAETELVEIHVSCDGSDKNSGTMGSPVKTLERARDIYRENRAKNSNFKGEIVVHGGVYRLSKSLELNNSDKGLTIRSYGDGEVLVRGSVALEKNDFEKMNGLQ